MMRKLKQVYGIVALLALLNLAVIVAGIAYLAATKRLSAERVQMVADALRGQPAGAEAGEPAAAPVEGKALDTRRPRKPSEPAPADGGTRQEIERRNLERVAMEADQKLLLVNRQMIEVERRREALDKQEARQQEASAEQVEEQEREGFQKDLEILSMLKPKVALDSLLARPIEDAAAMLLAMESRAGKKIFEEARKDPKKWSRMLTIQERMRNHSGGDAGSDEGGSTP